MKTHLRTGPHAALCHGRLLADGAERLWLRGGQVRLTEQIEDVTCGSCKRIAAIKIAPSLRAFERGLQALTRRRAQ